jgi:CheY-like chemotaxis protein
MKMLNSVLLVEDDDMVNFYNEFLLKDLKVASHIAVARNGQEALEYLDKCDGGAADAVFPDLIFLDINMPIMDGFEFIEEYEKRGKEDRARALVVMLTTSMHPKDMERAGQFESIGEYIYKPLMKEKLSEVVEKYFGKQ